MILKEVFSFLKACWRHVAKANIASSVAGRLPHWTWRQEASLVDVLCHVTKHQSELLHLLPFLPLLAGKVTLMWKLVYLCESHLHPCHPSSPSPSIHLSIHHPIWLEEIYNAGEPKPVCC